jgi:nucleoside-diphosphate-sugar epimerase
VRVLVTGAAGFIGSHLGERLLADGHRVRGLDLAPATEEAGSCEWLAGDITEAACCEAAVRGCDAVCHLAARVGDWGPAAGYMHVNVQGTRTLARAARAAGVRRFLLVSSVAVHHYRGLFRADESTPRDGRLNAYCRSKIAAEDALREAAGETMEWTIVRPGVFPFGPRDRTSFVHLAAAIARGRMGLVSGGRARVTTAYAENLAEGIALALAHPRAAGESFVIGDEGELSWRELLGIFSRSLGVSSPRRSVPLPIAYAAAWLWEGIYRLLRVKRAPLLTRYRVLLAGRDCHFVSDKARALLGYRPRVGIEEAVERTVAWYRRWTLGPGRV